MLFTIYYYIIAPIISIFCKVKINGIENVPKGRAIICGNHTSMMDPIFVAMAMYKKGRYKSKFMAKIELSKIPVVSAMISPLIVFVDRGKADMKAIKATIQLLNNNEKVVIFPEGRRVDVGEEAQAKTGVAMMSLKTGAPIVPVFLTEGKKPLSKFPRVEVTFGEAYVPAKEEGLSTSEAYRHIVDDLMDRIHKLKTSKA